MENSTRNGSEKNSSPVLGETVSSDFSWRSEIYAWAVVILLSIAFTFSMIDRMILTLLVEPIKGDFGLSDTQISLLHGLAFTLLYVLVGLPLGWLTDRYSRRTIAGVSIFFWSLATIACGIANNFSQLFLGRVGVGVGEAGLSPAANSLIADYFPPERLARPIAYFSIGGTVGVGLAYIFGGAIAEIVSGMGAVSVPLAGEIRPWQLTFFIVGIPGMLFAFLFLFVREPKRSSQSKISTKNIPVRETAKFFWGRKSFFLPHFAASAFAAMAVLSLHAWMPTLLIRTHGLSVGKAGGYYGLVVLIAGISGLLFGGWYSDRLAAKGVQASHIEVARKLVMFAILPTVAAPLCSSLLPLFLLAGCGVFGLGAAIALAPVALQIIVPNQMRGQIYAAYLLTLSLLGYTIGPTFVALATDFIFSNDAMVGRSMALVAGIGAPLALLCFTLSKRAYLKFPEAILDT